jgi:DnaJ-class molecular chaperone
MRSDLYAVLEVQRGASQRQIRSAYRRLACAYHPDKNADPDAAERFKAVAEAYVVLSDAVRRQLYDQTGDTRPRASARIDIDESAFE